jgi:hypothetical protein
MGRSSQRRLGDGDINLPRRGIVANPVHRQARRDHDAAAQAVAAFSRLGDAHAGRYATLEINPLILGPHGAVGVDQTHTTRETPT